MDKSKSFYVRCRNNKIPPTDIKRKKSLTINKIYVCDKIITPMVLYIINDNGEYVSYGASRFEIKTKIYKHIHKDYSVGGVLSIDKKNIIFTDGSGYSHVKYYKEVV